MLLIPPAGMASACKLGSAACKQLVSLGLLLAIAISTGHCLARVSFVFQALLANMQPDRCRALLLVLVLLAPLLLVGVVLQADLCRTTGVVVGCRLLLPAWRCAWMTCGVHNTTWTPGVLPRTYICMNLLACTAQGMHLCLQCSTQHLLCLPCVVTACSAVVLGVRQHAGAARQWTPV